MLIAETARRAERQTPHSVNRAIHDRTEMRIAAIASDPARIRARLAELDREWDVERCLETGSAALTLTGLLLGTLAHRRWRLLSGVVQAFFLQHALQGWCPPLPLFRSAGVRTAREIEAERHALKALLGEYTGASAPPAGDRRTMALDTFRTAMQ